MIGRTMTPLLCQETRNGVLTYTDRQTVPSPASGAAEIGSAVASAREINHEHHLTCGAGQPQFRPALCHPWQ